MDGKVVDNCLNSMGQCTLALKVAEVRKQPNNMQALLSAPSKNRFEEMRAVETALSDKKMGELERKLEFINMYTDEQINAELQELQALRQKKEQLSSVYQSYRTVLNRHGMSDSQFVESITESRDRFDELKQLREDTLKTERMVNELIGKH